MDRNEKEPHDANRDPLTGAPGAHPVGVGLGTAAGGMAAGAAAGAVAGPVGAVAGAVVGGIVGGLLLLNTGERVFRQLIPFLILLASVLLALQGRLRKWIVARQAKLVKRSDAWVVIPIFLASVYGGYFGAGLSVIVLAVLGLVIDDNLTRLNALKQAVAFCVNVAAALFFLFSGQVVWLAAGAMAIGAIAGGLLGGRLAGRIKPETLRAVVVVIGIAVSLIYFIRG